MRLPGCEGLLQVSLVEAACCMRLPRVSTLDATVGTLVLPKSTRGSGVVTQLPGPRPPLGRASAVSGEEAYIPRHVRARPGQGPADASLGAPHTAAHPSRSPTPADTEAGGSLWDPAFPVPAGAPACGMRVPWPSWRLASPSCTSCPQSGWVRAGRRLLLQAYFYAHDAGGPWGQDDSATAECCSQGWT